MIEVQCLNCNKIVNRHKSEIHKRTFCTRDCYVAYSSKHKGYKVSFRNPIPRIKSIRKLIKICDICGYDINKKMIQIHHRDSNRNNHSIENLQFICIWCHICITRGIPFHNRSDYNHA